MKHSIRREDVKYHVNKEKKIVVAILEHTEDLFINYIEENGGLYSYESIWRDLKKYSMPARFVGISKCGPDDEWDEDFGKLVAFDRLKEKLNKSFVKRANTYVHSIEEALDNFCDNTQIYLNKLAKNSERRKEIINKHLSED